MWGPPLLTWQSVVRHVPTTLLVLAALLIHPAVMPLALLEGRLVVVPKTPALDPRGGDDFGMGGETEQGHVVIFGPKKFKVRRPATLLGYAPKHSLDYGLQQTIEWFRTANPQEPA